METIIDRLQQYTEKNPGAAILYDDTYTKGITYAQLDDMSGRVYGWLKMNKIGKEDFVLIDMPRGVLPVIAMIGVWKADAGFGAHGPRRSLSAALSPCSFSENTAFNIGMHKNTKIMTV